MEQAILRQDPSLVVDDGAASAQRDLPVLGPRARTTSMTADAFYGRDNEIDESLRRLTAVGVLVVVGPSGSGKSSLVRAGVAAALERAGRRVVVITPGAHPMDALTVLSSDGPAPVLVVDQCEEIATLCEDPAEQRRFFAALDETRRHGDRWSSRCAPIASVNCPPILTFARLVEPRPVPA